MADIVLSDLLQCLVECSEKAAKIAQIFREAHDIFEILIQEKSESESNKRFGQDFKTLADVLVQETIKKDVGQKFPELVSQIRGEEQNSFETTRGEHIDVILTDSIAETTLMLDKVLDGQDQLAKAIAKIVHSRSIVSEKQSYVVNTYPVNKLGIWIDPIDSTAEFIEGNYDETEEYGIKPYGLKCVCVLIGVYDLDTFAPVMGVVNQPFYYRISEDDRWESKFYWGMNIGTESCASSSVHVKETDDEESCTSPVFPSNEIDCIDVTSGDECSTPESSGNLMSFSMEKEKKIILISSSENIELQELMRRNYIVVHTAGAGHKSLLVAIQNADLYILSKSTIYFWDTCGPHAILSAVGGGMLKLKSVINDHEALNDFDFLEKCQVKYEAYSGKSGTEAFQNHEGIIAYRDPHVVLEFLRYLKDNGYVVS